MNAHQPIACALSLLTLSTTLPAQQPAPAAATEPAPTHHAPDIALDSGYRITANSKLHIVFCVPMVEANQVGSEVKPEYFNTNFAGTYRALWESQSSIRLEFTQQLPALERLRVEVPAGLRGLKGEVLAGRVRAFPTYEGEVADTGTCDNDSLFLRAMDSEFLPALQKRLPDLYYICDDGTRGPLKCRPATVADALANWYAFDSVHCYNLDSHDRKELAKHPADEVLPDTWIVEAPGIPDSNRDVRIMLPRAEWDNKAQDWVDRQLHCYSAPYAEIAMSNECTSRGKYEICLALGMPAAAADAAELIAPLNWSMLEEAHSNEWKPLTWKDGALRGKIRGKDITITPTATECRELNLIGKGTVRGISSVTLTAETGGREILVKAEGKYPTVSTPRGVERDITGDSDTPADCTHLRPRQPYIYTNLSANHLQLRGSTTLNCRYGQLERGTARVYKINAATPADKVRLLRDYYRLYFAQEYTTWQQEDAQRKERKTAGLDDEKIEHNRVDTATLPGVVATAERPLQQGAEHELSLPLAELFDNQPVGGFYFVDIEGEPVRNSKTPVVNQGLLQITDLGLMWKTNGSHLLAWGYKLSDAQELPAATLHLLDEQGNTLAELPMANGLAEGNFHPATRYLMLTTADDCVLMPHLSSDIEYSAHMGESWEFARLLSKGIAPAAIPKPLVFLFSDRSLYRPGETAHTKGIVRWLTDNELQNPDIESISARLLKDYKEPAKLPPVTVQQDGSFTLDIPLDAVGDYTVEFTITYRGDADKTSPDLAVVHAKSTLAQPPADDVTDDEEGEDDVEDDEKGDEWEGEDDINFSAPREARLELTCREFRRNEFEVSSQLTALPDERKLELSATATNLTTTPVAHGKVKWNLAITERNFYPEQQEWSEFRFGDYRENPWEFFYARYMNSYSGSDRDYLSREGTLDAEGRGTAAFTLPKQQFPRMQRIVATTTVTNGNEQSINSVQKTTLHPADVYVGIRPHTTLAKVGGTLPVDLVAVTSDGKAWSGEPVTVTITATRSAFYQYRYGSRFSTSVQNTEIKDTTHTITATLTGTPTTVQVPVDIAGRYDITVTGKDARGREFASATRHYVWGDDTSPWEHMKNYEMELVPDKPLYHSGDTAKVLVKTPVDAELLITVERDRVLRHYRRSVTVDSPVIEIPLEAADAPVVYLSAFLVQTNKNRESDGKPQLRLGTCQLNITTPDKKLNVQLQPPPHSLLPGESCTVSGTITGADGKPVPNADITLYAEDEGTLQVTGYDLPDPAAYFYSEVGREHAVATYSGLTHLAAEGLRHRYFGNKGVFIGGGDDDEYEAEAEGADAADDSERERLRTDFNPCALWLATVRTDAKGNFTATYSNPDTLTRYRLMAVAAAGDRFGSGQSSYLVNKPVMLEPSVPMSVTEGDELQLPVTVSMLPEYLPGVKADQAIQWQVNLSSPNAELPLTTQSVTLTGKSPVTIHFPVKIPRGNGPVQLQWQVKAADTPQGCDLKRAKDAVQLSFPTTPPTPHLREYVWTELPIGQSTALSSMLKHPYRADGTVQLSFSTSPLAGLAYPLQYLFTYPYGCTEQLSSTVLPWLLQEHLQQALGVKFPQAKKAATIAAEVDKKLSKRRLAPGRYGYWDGDTKGCEFSAYAAMVRFFINGAENEEVLSDMRALVEQIQANAENTYLNMLVLSLLVDDTTEIFNSFYLHAEQNLASLNPQERWILAIAAADAKHPQAADLLKQAQQSSNSPAYLHYALPPVQALRAIYAIATEPESPATADLLRNWLQQSAGCYSTWQNAWLTIAVAEYAGKRDLSKLRARVNGTDITSATPMHLVLATGATDSFTAIGNTVYVSGFAEGYLNKEQPEQAIDRGFRVQRRYEQLQPDGTWKPTGTFRVGDIVRVTVNATARRGEANLKYLAIEDRLPAAFEAIDPTLTSQALPVGISEQTYRSWWYFPTTISNREFLKDRVRAFSNNLWGNSQLEFSYIARVVRSGRVTAPAAKAELMYRPEFHGLSIPQHFEVEPRPQE